MILVRPEPSQHRVWWSPGKVACVHIINTNNRHWPLIDTGIVSCHCPGQDYINLWEWSFKQLHSWPSVLLNALLKSKVSRKYASNEVSSSSLSHFISLRMEVVTSKISASMETIWWHHSPLVQNLNSITTLNLTLQWDKMQRSFNCQNLFSAIFPI